MINYHQHNQGRDGLSKTKAGTKRDWGTALIQGGWVRRPKETEKEHKDQTAQKGKCDIYEEGRRQQSCKELFHPKGRNMPKVKKKKKKRIKKKP